MRRIVLTTLVVLSPLIASANEANDSLKRWYALNEECRGSLNPRSKETLKACFTRDKLSMKLIDLNCKPSDTSDTWTCPK